MILTQCGERERERERERGGGGRERERDREREIICVRFCGVKIEFERIEFIKSELNLN